MYTMSAKHQAPRLAGAYSVIYADPPWNFATYSRKGRGRSAHAHYDCMSQSDLEALPVADWAADDAKALIRHYLDQPVRQQEARR